MLRYHAQVGTPRASRNLTRLCKHFRHKVSVDYDERRARIEFPFGRCRMEATPDSQRIDCAAEPGPADARLRFVLEDHLLRFSGEEALRIDWRDGPLGEEGGA